MDEPVLSPPSCKHTALTKQPSAPIHPHAPPTLCPHTPSHVSPPLTDAPQVQVALVLGVKACHVAWKHPRVRGEHVAGDEGHLG